MNLKIEVERETMAAGLPSHGTARLLAYGKTKADALARARRSRFAYSLIE